jgi:hypothetical protein
MVVLKLGILEYLEEQDWYIILSHPDHAISDGLTIIAEKKRSKVLVSKWSNGSDSNRSI